VGLNLEAYLTLNPSSESLRHATELIDTSHTNPDATRALVVWNPKETSTRGIAVFHAEYRMKRSIALIGVDVRNGSGLAAQSALWNVVMRDTGDGSDTHHVVSFDLAFIIEEIAPRSWATYFASYAAAAGELTSDAPDAAMADVVVLETLCHTGLLPACGSFDNLSPFMLY